MTCTWWDRWMFRVQVGSSLPPQEWQRSAELKEKGIVKGRCGMLAADVECPTRGKRGAERWKMFTWSATGQPALLTSCAKKKAQGLEVWGRQPGTPVSRNVIQNFDFRSPVIQTRTRHQWVYVAVQTDVEEMPTTIKMNPGNKIVEKYSPSPVRDMAWFNGACWLGRTYTPYIREMWCQISVNGKGLGNITCMQVKPVLALRALKAFNLIKILMVVEPWKDTLCTEYIQ